MATNRFQADYGKRAAGCKKCKGQLTKGECRLAKISPNPFVQNPDGGPPPDMKQYFHPACLFETFKNARATTKVIEEPSDIEGYGELEKSDKEVILKLIEELMEKRGNKGAAKSSMTSMKEEKKNATPDKVEKSITPKKAEKSITAKKEDDSSKLKGKAEKEPFSLPKAEKKKEDEEKFNESSKFNSFYRFCKLCDVIASLPKYKDKSKTLSAFITKEGYDGDTVTLFRLLLPSIDQRVYNIKEKQILKHFASAFSLKHEELLASYQESGDVSLSISQVFEKKKDLSAVAKSSDWSIQKMDRWLEKLAGLSGDHEQKAHLQFAAKRLSALEIKYMLRLIKKDLRITAGVRHILDGLDASAYDAFQSCRDLPELIRKLQRGEKLVTGLQLGTPVLPMLAEACGSVDMVMSRCAGDLMAEIKYDGERLQLHKNQDSFSFFSRSLKPVQDHKVALLQSAVQEAFVDGDKLILDAEILMVDTTTGKPLPFGTLGIHKKNDFKNASVCLFVFDILLYNEDILINKPLSERRGLLEQHMKEVQNRVQLSNVQLIRNGDKKKLNDLIFKAIDEGLEGLVVKDTLSIYEPGKRRWLKVKKDYLKVGGLADSADLILLGGYYGTGNHGGILSVFLMGVYDKKTEKYLTVTKCGNGHTDEQLEKINKELSNKMKKIGREFNALPSWLDCHRALVPDFIIEDPSEAPVWEITGAEFSRSDRHTAHGISIRFPRVTRIRDDKDVNTSTSLQELQKLFENSKCRNEKDESEEDEIPLYAHPRNGGGDANMEEEDKKERDTNEEGEKTAQTSSDKGELRNNTRHKGKKGKGPQNKKRKVDEASEEEISESSADDTPSDLNTPVKRGKKRRGHESSSDSSSEEDSDSDSDREEVLPKGKDRRTPCKYGKDCYRKNPTHLARYSHLDKQ